MRRFVIPLLCVALTMPCAAERPNMLFFLADDQRGSTLGCAGDAFAVTPTIDSLAERGVRFTNAFVTTPICAASRASILTGVTERTHAYTFTQPPIAGWLAAASYPALLKRAGYRTAFIGKFGVDIEGDPATDLFDVFSNRDRPYLRTMPDSSVRHIDEMNTEEAVAFLRTCSASTPFALSIGFSSPHAEDADLENHYPCIDAVKDLHVNAIFPPPRLNAPEIFENQPEFLRDSLNRTRFFWRWDTPEKYQRNMRGYYRLIAGVDVMIKRVLDALDAQGLAGNTVIVYMADNGYYMGERGFAGKWSHYEESIRVPLIVLDPRRPQHDRGRTVDALVTNIDLTATLLDLGGIDVPTHYQGRSLRPFIEGRTPTDGRTDFLVEHRWDRPDIPKWEGVRTSTHMYARYDSQNPPYEFLHDLAADPDELQNLANDPQSGGILAELRAKTTGFVHDYTDARASGE